MRIHSFKRSIALGIAGTVGACLMGITGPAQAQTADGSLSRTSTASVAAELGITAGQQGVKDCQWFDNPTTGKRQLVCITYG